MIPSRDRDPKARRREMLTSLLAMLASAAVVITCSANRAQAPQAPASLAPVSESAASAPLVAAPLVAEQQPAQAPEPQTLPSSLSTAPLTPLALPRFSRALAELTSGDRQTHVRVAWLGDSHTAADLWTGAVRKQLQARFGNGGPGFVHIGWDSPRYRHDGIKAQLSSKWSVEPAQYAKSTRHDDGVLGLGGVRFAPSGAGSRASIELTEPADATALTWDLAYRLLDPHASLRVTVQGASEGGEPVAIELDARSDEPGAGDIRHHSFTSEGKTGRLSITAQSNRAQLFGAVVEGEKPGLVLDTLGLNGARVSTFLAWDEAAWQGELGRRNPALVVLAFGTNESSDPAPTVERYARVTAQLLARVKKAAPEADCLVILPMDRKGSDYPSRLATISAGMSVSAHEAGCATWSALDAMGGSGSMRAWSNESPARASSDGVHLTGRGYAYLGDQLAVQLLPSPPGVSAAR